ncbi:MAG: hypothetical protein ABI623_13030 [bacterium]
MRIVNILLWFLSLVILSCNKKETIVDNGGGVNVPVFASTQNAFSYSINAQQLTFTQVIPLTFNKNRLHIAVAASNVTQGKAIFVLLDQGSGIIHLDTFKLTGMYQVVQQTGLPASASVSFQDFSGSIQYALVADTLIEAARWEQTTLSQQWEVQAIASDSSGRIFVGTWGGGGFRSSDHGTTWIHLDGGSSFDDILCFAMCTDNIVLAGTAGGGLYRSMNNGNTWTYLDSSRMGGLVEDLYSNPQGEVLAGIFFNGIYYSSNRGNNWAASGGSYDNRINSVLIAPNGNFLASTIVGLYCSTNKGLSWTLNANGLLPRSLYSLVLSPRGDIWGASDSRLYRSSDQGVSWIRVKDFGTLVLGDIDIEHNDNLYIGIADSGVIRSTDYGNTWFAINEGLLNRRVRSLAVGSDGYLYAGTQSAGLFRRKIE